jgi:magnesium and cobalt transporter
MGLSSTERNLIQRVLEMQYRTVGQVARSLAMADTVSEDTPIPELLALCRQRGHTRIPVWGGPRETRRIVGVVSLKNLLYSESDLGTARVADFLRPALFLEESVRLEEALRRLQRSGMPLAIVVDAQRREQGIVTLSDVLRGVFGEVIL